MNDKLCSCGKYNVAKGLRYCCHCAKVIKKALREKESFGEITVYCASAGRMVTFYR